MARPTFMDLDRWARYAGKIQCERCGEEIFGNIEEARDTVEFVMEHYDLNTSTQAADWRLYLIDHTDGYCDYCRHVMNKDD